jgi:hypothetical protein
VSEQGAPEEEADGAQDDQRADGVDVQLIEPLSTGKRQSDEQER